MFRQIYRHFFDYFFVIWKKCAFFAVLIADLTPETRVSRKGGACFLPLCVSGGPKCDRKTAKKKRPPGSEGLFISQGVGYQLAETGEVEAL